jgi:hypothetical protein
VDDDELLARFEAGTLPAFPHEDHVRTVYLLICRDGEDLALEAVTAGIRAMAAANDKPEAFHVTRTTAWTRIVAGLIRDTGGMSEEFLERHPQLLRRDLLDDFYDAGRLTTDEARTNYIEPDRPFRPESRGSPSRAT